LAARLTRENLPGVRFVPVDRTPGSSVFANQACHGVQIIVDDWSRFEPLRTGLTVALALRELFPDGWNPERYDRLLGHKATWEAVKAGKPWAEIEAGWRADLEAFRALRKKYLLYE